jgi:hypothetical protein
MPDACTPRCSARDRAKNRYKKCGRRPFHRTLRTRRRRTPAGVTGVHECVVRRRDPAATPSCVWFVEVCSDASESAEVASAISRVTRAGREGLQGCGYFVCGPARHADVFSTLAAFAVGSSVRPWAIGAAPTFAHASTGCDAVNAGGYNVTNANVNIVGTISGFAVGDQITLVYRSPQGGDLILVGSVPLLFAPVTPAPSTTAYTVTGNNGDTTIQVYFSPSDSTAVITVSATCVAAAAPGPSSAAAGRP